MRLLITGCDGFIGAATSVLAMERGHEVVGLDDRSAGTHEVPGMSRKIVRDLNCIDEITRQAMMLPTVDVVIHLAAMHFIEQCEREPLRTVQTNVGATTALVKWCEENKKPMVFASTAAVYGNPDKTPIDEHDPIATVGVYGETKVWCEKVLRWSKLDWTMLRFFNVVGAYGGYGERPGVEHILPTIFRLAKTPKSIFRVNGSYHATADGTCIRDYVNVKDIANGLLLAAERLKKTPERLVVNLGTRSGHSVLEALKIANEFLESRGEAPVAHEFGPPRKGDPVALMCDYSKAEKVLGWAPTVPFKESVAQTWETLAKRKVTGEVP